MLNINSDERYIRVREERKKLGLTQTQAAEGCGVTRQQWGRYETGNNAFDGSIVRAFGAIGADTTYILTGEREIKGTIELQKQHAKALATVQAAMLQMQLDGDTIGINIIADMAAMFAGMTTVGEPRSKINKSEIRAKVEGMLAHPIFGLDFYK